jgi:hypothetical protein
MSDANRALPPSATPTRSCITCTYLEQTARGQGNRSAYTSYCTKYGTNAHEERSSLGTCGPTGTAWTEQGTEVTQEYVRDQPAPPVATGTMQQTTVAPAKQPLPSG